MIIIGAGMTGLLAAQLLRRWNPTVWEAQAKLPDNHGALLRFRSDAVSVATGIPFKKVNIQKAVLWGERLWADTCPLPAQNAYAIKVTGKASGRSIRDLRPGDRFIAPDDFLTQLATGVNVVFGKVAASANLIGTNTVPIVSTIPMPALMTLMDWPSQPAFPHRPVWSHSATLPSWVDLYQTIYYPDPETTYYRASVTGRKLIVEYSDVDCCLEDYDLDGDLKTVIQHFGLGGYDAEDTLTDHKFSRQEYGKLLPCSDELGRRAFIVAMTDRSNIYSVGRFATWRQILLDDVVNDCAVVNRFITERSAYGRRLAALR